jgi:magnesium transporter
MDRTMSRRDEASGAGHPSPPRGRLKRFRLRPPRRAGQGPGATPGIGPEDLERMTAPPEGAIVTCIDYGPDQIRVEEVTDLEGFLARHRPEWSAVRWINVDRLGDPRVIGGLAAKYRLHPLAVEDVIHVGQRPKADAFPARDDYQARMFVVGRMVQLVADRIHSEQISIFLGHKTVLTFQEDPGDVWGPIRQRLAAKGSRLRDEDASFLVYSLLDAVVDHCFPILETYGDRLEGLEDLVLENPNQDAIREIRMAKRDLLLLRHAVWPMRDVINSLQREPHECMSQTSQVYLRDVSDHLVQIIDILEAYREVATGLNETYMTAMSNRLNEVMKLLTIVGTIFIPMTFLAGVYGMNFHHMPELDWVWAYPLFWVACLGLAGGMVLWLRRQGWL